MVDNFGYALDFNWEHSWPRSPVPVDEVQRLQSLQKYRIVNTPKEDMYDTICKTACAEMQCPISGVSFIDHDRQWFKASSGLTQTAIPRDVAFCAHALMTPNAPLIVLDTQKDARFQHNPLVTRASQIRFYAAVPILSADKLAIGTVFVFDTAVHESCNTESLSQLASQVATLMQRRIAGNAPRRSTYLSKQSKMNPTGQPIPKVVKEVAMVPAGEKAVNKNDANSSALVSHQPPKTSDSVALANAGNGNAGQVGNMLMQLLARTTETQQQLATQQTLMFQTMGQHGDQLHQLQEKLMMLEKQL